jgi:type II secretory pathway component HofQ
MEARMFWRVLVALLLVPALAFSYTVVRKDGKTFQGKLVRESAGEIVLKDKDGVQIQFKKDQIDWDKTTAERRKEEEKQIGRRLGRSVELKREPKQKWMGEKISLDFKDIDIRDLFRFLAETGDLNLVIDPNVTGTVTIKMTKVPWDQVLDVVCKMHDLRYTVDGNVIRIHK